MNKWQIWKKLQFTPFHPKKANQIFLAFNLVSDNQWDEGKAYLFRYLIINDINVMVSIS